MHVVDHKHDHKLLRLESQQRRVEVMAGLEEIEIAQYIKELAADLRHIGKKYCRTVSWEVPEFYEQAAWCLILDVMQEWPEKVNTGQT